MKKHFEEARHLIKLKGIKKKPRPEHFINKEISWIEFNGRVLDEAIHKDTQLLDKLAFLSIFTKNQDEFFMVRVAGLKKMEKEGFVACESPERLPIVTALEQIHQRSKALNKVQYECFHQTILPALDECGVKILNYEDLDKEQKERLDAYFSEEVFPVLTPLAVDPSHPFPFLTNLSLYLLIEFPSPGSKDHLIGFVEIPSVIPRLIPVENKENKHHFLLLENLVKAHLENLFLGFDVKDSCMIRVTRNLDYTLLENRVVDLLESIQKEVINRVQPEAVRLEVEDNINPKVLKTLKKILRIEELDIYYTQSPIYLSGFTALCKLPLPHLKQDGFNPRLPPWMAGSSNIFSLIRKKDLLIHHPYESFYAITEFLGAAASDPDVYAIKQTLYRSSGDSPVIDALIKAAENGKQVTTVVELKARFDEKNNVVWARRLERAGVHVVYGFVGLKTHCKTTLVVRKENDRMMRYVHLSTGNYNSQTAKQYTDLGLLTAKPEFGKDISALFNLLTGFNILKEKEKLIGSNSLPRFDQIILSPLYLRNFILQEIDRVINDHRKEGGGLIVVKVNALDDEALIQALYKASQNGVEIRLIVRGICCLRPGIKGLSEHIEVISIVDRFLEHSRIYYFSSGASDRVYLGSADWMTRNMDRRIELMYPIQDPDLKERIILEILGGYWKDNTRARKLNGDGSYALKTPPKGKPAIRSQSYFIDLAREAGIKSLPYDKAVRFDPKKKGRRPVATRPGLTKPDHSQK